jgi:hypothetical protein
LKRLLTLFVARRCKSIDYFSFISAINAGEFM